jgi:DNA-directed RNA polymerase subunit M/transcription elongation factor TFIIS
MYQLVNPARCCPECGSREYVFRGRKKLPAEAEQPAAVETKYACRACGHTWKERVVAKAAG